MGGFPVKPRVIEMLEARFVGKRVTRADLHRISGFTEEQLRAAMRSLAEEPGSGVTVVARGNIWDYKVGQTPTEPVDTLYETVGTSAGGDVIVRGDVTGKLYKVVPF